MKPNTHWAKHARGGADVKLIIALIFALGGLSWGAITIMSSGKPRQAEGARVVDSVIDSSGNDVDADYTKASSTKQIQSVENEIREAIQSQAQSVLGAIDAPKGLPEGVGDATLNAFIPILSGDHDSFVDAVAAMGGQLPGEFEEDHPLFTHLTKIFSGAKVDLSRVTIERFVTPTGERIGKRREVQTEDVEIDPDNPGNGGVQTSVMELQPASMFPGAPPKQDPTAVQIKIPVQPKGEKNESVFALILTWNKEAKQWQPAAYQVIRNRRVEDD